MRSPLPIVALALVVTLGGAAAVPHLRAVDGDTVAVDGTAVRILGLDAPEMRGRCGAERRLARAAKRRLAGLLARPDAVVVATGRRDKYRRPLAHVYVGGEDVAAILVRDGLARPYGGERRAPWCIVLPLAKPERAP